MPRAGRLQRYARGSHAGVAGRPRLGKAPVSWKINPKEVQTLRHGSREDHEEFLMDIETVIAASGSATSAGVVWLVGPGDCARPGGDAGRGWQVTMRDGIPASSSARSRRYARPRGCRRPPCGRPQNGSFWNSADRGAITRSCF